jgi:hypothetical protein
MIARKALPVLEDSLASTTQAHQKKAGEEPVFDGKPTPR